MMWIFGQELRNLWNFVKKEVKRKKMMVKKLKIQKVKVIIIIIISGY